MSQKPKTVDENKERMGLEEVLFLTPDVSPSMREGFVSALCLSGHTWFSP